MLAATAVTANAAPLQVQDDRGVRVQLPAPAQRVVSLLPSLTESVCALGACERLVGTDNHSNWPQPVRALPKLGGLEDAQVEAIVRLQPDLVLVAPSARAIERLEALGLKVLALHSRDQADLRRSLHVLAQALALGDAPQRVWAGIESQMAAAAAQVPASMKGKQLYFEVDATPYAAGQASYVGEIMARLGLRNIVPATLGPFPRLNPEFVVRAQPDVVLASQRSLSTLAQRPGWSSLRALQAGQTCGFNEAQGDTLARAGPRLGEAALWLAQCLQTLAERSAQGPAPARLAAAGAAAPR